MTNKIINGRFTFENGTIPQNEHIKVTNLTPALFASGANVGRLGTEFPIDNGTGDFTLTLAVPDDAQQAALYLFSLPKFEPGRDEFQAPVSSQSPSEWEAFLGTVIVFRPYDKLPNYVMKTGDTMTGILTLSGDPTENMHAATRQFVLNNVGPGGNRHTIQNEGTNLPDQPTLNFTGKLIEAAVDAPNNRINVTVDQPASLDPLYLFDTSTIAGDPGMGYVRFNNAAPASVTELYIHWGDVTGKDSTAFFNALQTNDFIYFQNPEDSNKRMGMVITQVNNNTGWYTIIGTPTEYLTLPASNDDLLCRFYYFAAVTDVEDLTTLGGTDGDMVRVQGGKLQYRTAVQVRGDIGAIPDAPANGSTYGRNNNNWVVVTGGGGNSPLNTKGDIYTYSTADDRLPVGTNGQIVEADSSEATGLKWRNFAHQGTHGYGQADQIIDSVYSNPVDSQVKVKQVIGLTQAEYDALTPDANTLYLITG